MYLNIEIYTLDNSKISCFHVNYFRFKEIVYKRIIVSLILLVDIHTSYCNYYTNALYTITVIAICRIKKFNCGRF
jgi:hypothetical protein